jgi:hypothetical protein
MHSAGTRSASTATARGMIATTSPTAPRAPRPRASRRARARNSAQGGLGRPPERPSDAGRLSVRRARRSSPVVYQVYARAVVTRIILPMALHRHTLNRAGRRVDACAAAAIIHSAADLGARFRGSTPPMAPFLRLLPRVCNRACARHGRTRVGRGRPSNAEL